MPLYESAVTENRGYVFTVRHGTLPPRKIRDQEPSQQWHDRQETTPLGSTITNVHRDADETVGTDGLDTSQNCHLCEGGDRNSRNPVLLLGQEW